MPTQTTNMKLNKAIDGDNAESYLAASLAASLDVLDGHRHTGTTDGLQLIAGSYAAGSIATGALAAGAATGAALGADVATLAGAQSLSSKTLVSPVLSGAATGDGTIPVRVLVVGHGSAGGGVATITTNAYATLLTASITVACPAGNTGLVFIVAHADFNTVQNTSKNNFSMALSVDSGVGLATGTTEIGRIETTPLDAATFGLQIAGVALLPSGARTITLKALWQTVTGAPTAALVNDTRYASIEAAQVN